MGVRGTAPCAINIPIMTYRELLERLDNLDDEQLDTTAFACVDDEMYPLKNVQIQEGSGDALRDGDPYIMIE